MTNLEITNAYVGDTQVEKICLGTDIVWQGETPPGPEPEYDKMYLTFEVIEGNTIYWKSAGNPTVSSNIEYSTDDGSTWESITATSTGTPISVEPDMKVLFKGNLTKTHESNSKRLFFYTDEFNSFKAYGNPMSLFYGDNFVGQTTLPADGAMGSMFYGCNGLVDASNLVFVADTHTPFCYTRMFYSCKNLVTPPSIINGTVNTSSCSNMFYGCTSLTTAPELPATTLANSCYSSMFRNCSGLTQAPELPATTLADSCYQFMLANTSLAQAPALPATTLAPSCYKNMFTNCTNLTTAPELPATTLTNMCYNFMFNGCTSLNYIKAMFTTTPSTSYTSNWVSGVASAGTFVKNSAATWAVTGSNGIPTGWEVEDFKPGPFTLESQANANEFTIAGSSDAYSQLSGVIKHNDGTEETVYPSQGTITLDSGETLSLKTAQILPLVDVNIASTGEFKVYGNIMSLVDPNYDDPEQAITDLTQVGDCTFSYLFVGATTLTDASGLLLPATTLADSCYAFMFQDCTSLTKAPALPATTLAYSCYDTMFGDCTSLTQAPELPATTLTGSCYNSMFYNCTSLKHISCLATDISLGNYTGMWVDGVASTGTFVKKAGVEWPSGIDGIPDGWTVVEV